MIKVVLYLLNSNLYIKGVAMGLFSLIRRIVAKRRLKQTVEEAVSFKAEWPDTIINKVPVPDGHTSLTFMSGEVRGTVTVLEQEDFLRTTPDQQQKFRDWVTRQGFIPQF